MLLDASYWSKTTSPQVYYQEHDNVQARKTSQTKPKGGYRTRETVDRYIRQQTKGHQTRVMWF